MIRQEAIVKGHTRYFGKICKNHPEMNGERMTSNSHCLRCMRDRKKVGGSQHETALARNRKGGINHASQLARGRKGGSCYESRLSRQRKGGTCYEIKKKNVMTYNRKGSPGYAAARSRGKAYLARQLCSVFDGYRKEVAVIYAAVPEGMTVDHIIPLKGVDPVTKAHIVCGLHVPWNLQYLTVEENSRKCGWFIIN